MKNLIRYLTHGWHILAEIHTAIWLCAVVVPILISGFFGVWAFVSGLSAVEIAAIVVVLFGLFFLIGLGVIGIRYEKREKLTQPSKLSETPSQPVLTQRTEPTKPVVAVDAWEFVDGVDPQFLISFFKKHMNVEAKRLTEPYLGKTLTVRGQLDDVHYSPEYKSGIAYLKASPDHSIRMPLHFEGEWAEKISQLPRTTKLEVQGQVREIWSFEVSLKNCTFSILGP